MVTGQRVHELARQLRRDGTAVDEPDAIAAAIRLLTAAEHLADRRERTPHRHR
jgi:hypothetical protein